MSGKGKRAFTLLEVTVALSVSSILACMAVAGFKHCRSSMTAGRVAAEVTAIDDALERYLGKRGRLPADADGDGVVSEAEIAAELREWGYLANLKTDGEYVVDPWGVPYVIVLACDYDVRADDVLVDAAGDPFNDFVNGYQVYSTALLGTDYENDFAHLSNVAAAEETQVATAAETALPPLTEEDIAMLAAQADKAAVEADKYYAKAVDYYSKGNLDKAIDNATLASDYATGAMNLANLAAAYDSQYQDKAAAYTAKAGDYADYLAWLESLL